MENTSTVNYSGINCDEAKLLTGDVFIGPLETYQLLGELLIHFQLCIHGLLGWWAVSMYVILALHCLPILIFTLLSVVKMLKNRKHDNFFSHLYLTCLPLLLVTGELLILIG